MQKQNQSIQQSNNRPKPLLMVPLRRCGSHALRLRLNFNSDFYSPYPLHLVDFMPLVGMYGNLEDDEVYFQLIIDFIGLQTVSLVRWPDVVFDPTTVFNAIKDKPRSIHSIAWELLLQAGEKNQAKIVMDKSLDNVHYAEELLELFDDMLFLQVVRDPRAQISSINRAIIHDFDTVLNAMTWVKAYETGKKLAQKYPDKVLTIRFEDFVANEEAVLRKICQFLSIDFLPTMLDISQSQEARDISTLSALWESNASEPIPANVDKFKQHLSLEEIEIIETLASSQMDYYGYEKMTASQTKITPEMIAAAKERSEKKKQEAWSKLKATNYKDYQLRMFRSAYIQMVKARLENRVAERSSFMRKVS
jgi:hypothetical protein